MSDFDLSVLFFLQLAVILGTCRLVGRIARHFGQPQVVAEMIAGVLLGPSLFGWVAPQWQQALFPPQSMTILYAVSQVGLALYMFVVGMELRSELLRNRVRQAVSISLAGMLVPFVLGGALALWLVADTGRFFAAKTTPAEAAVFLGAALCITAFPMLARIIHERGLAGTSLGTLALTAGATDDAAAWALLALVLSSFSGDWSTAAMAIGGGIAYALVMLTAGAALLRGFAAYAARDGVVSSSVLAAVLGLVMLGAWFTDRIGIYAVFGAFLAGTAVPRGVFAEQLRERIEPLVVTLLLPLFFTYSGLRTRLDLVDTPALWAVAVVVLVAAVIGKGGACWAAARLHGEDRPTALAIGTLMNARGLMELIIVNIGLSRGIITPQLFSILVLMAIVTTLMASPLFERVYGRHARAGRIAAAGS